MAATTRFVLRIPEPDSHLLEVEARFELDRGRSYLDLILPAWAPGSYLVREYARHIQQLRALDPESGETLAVRQLDKASWRVETEGRGAIEVHYAVWSHELAVRTNHIDDTHASINPVAALLYPDGGLERAVRVAIEAPQGWSVHTGLKRGAEGSYEADDFDELYDCPIEISAASPTRFEAAGRPHELVFWGAPNLDPAQIARDLAAIVEANRSLFGGPLPYDDYTFIVHLTDKGRGGLEHRNSTLLIYARDGFRDGPPGSERDERGFPTKPYLDFLRLASHEHFHAWNVKRIRPAALGPFDYRAENYTRDLWTVEGVTSYYENIALRRAELMSATTFLSIVADAARALDAVPGRQLHSLEDASLNAWVKAYRPDENTINSSVSYYLKGELVCFLLDAEIRARTDHERSLDDVLRALWAAWLEEGRGYAEGSYASWVERATGVDLGELIEAYTRGTVELDFERALSPFGARLVRGHKKEGQAWLGIALEGSAPMPRVRRALAGAPAAEAGIYAGDRLVAIDNRAISKSVSRLIARYAPGDRVRLTLFRRGLLIERDVELGPAPPDQYAIEPDPNASERARRRGRAWWGDWNQEKKEGA